MTVPSAIRIAIAAAGLALLAACGGGDRDPESTEGDGGPSSVLVAPGAGDGGAGIGGGPGPVAVPDVCSLLTVDEASLIAGEPLRVPTADQSAGGIPLEICTYGAQAFMSYTYVQVSMVAESRLTPELRASGYDAARVFEEARAASEPVDPVEGLGEAAYRHGNTVEVLAGGVTFAVKIGLNDREGGITAPLDDLVHVARLVLERLPDA